MNTTKNETRPITLTITGELAERIRQEAKLTGVRADTGARQLLMEAVGRAEGQRKGERWAGIPEPYPTGKLPVYLDADDVRYMQAVCGAADLTADAWIQDIVGTSVQETREHGIRAMGFACDIAEEWQGITPEHIAAMEAMIEKLKAE